ncbi:serine hydrolase domain-containing protein [Roseivirga sp.]|uniref:serine hydrolase domain-containing protein n=1 Tax=Roseivirga sp. TaxID=1964215 RepID=UPI003B8C1048
MDSNVINFIKESIKYYDFPQVSLGMVVNQRDDFHQHFNLEDKTKTCYKVGSITKTITALGILKLVEERKMCLETNIHMILSGFGHLPFYKDFSTIRIVDLLLHQSGLPRGNSRYSNPSFKEVANELENIEELSARTYKYSNLGYIILGLVIEKIAQKSFEQYVKENILIPLEMRNSGFGPEKSLLTTPNASTYLHSSEYRDRRYKKINMISGAHSSFDLHVSVQDFANLIHCILNNGQFNGKQVFQEKSIIQLFSNKCRINERVCSCLGLDEISGLGNKIYVANGEHWGHSASVLLVPKYAFGMILMTNRGSCGAVLAHLLQKVNRYLLMQRDSHHLSFHYHRAKDIIGEFIDIDSHKVLEICIENNLELSMKFNGTYRNQIRYWGQGIFDILEGELSQFMIILEFSKDGVSGLKVGPYHFAKKGALLVKKKNCNFSLLEGVYYNSTAGLLSVFNRNGKLFIGYSASKESELLFLKENRFIQLDGPFKNEEIEFDNYSSRMIVNEMTFVKTIEKKST